MTEAVSGTSDKLTDLLDRLGRMTRCLQFAHGLNPAQWESLRFIARANRFSRTPSALATFLGTTKGTASQTLISLENKGCLRRVRGHGDRRVTQLELTETGHALLTQDPLACVDRAAQDLPDDLFMVLRDALGRLADRLESSNGWCKLGVCEKCGNGLGETADGGFRCGLKNVDVPAAEASRLCVNFCGDGPRAEA